MGRPWEPPEPHLPRRRGEAVRPRGFPRQRVAVSHCVARVPRVVASGATRRGVPLASLFPAVARRESVRPVVATAADLKELLNPLGGLTSFVDAVSLVRWAGSQGSALRGFPWRRCFPPSHGGKVYAPL